MERVEVVIPAFHPGDRLIRILEWMEVQTLRPCCVRIINTEREGLEALLQREHLTEQGLLERFPFLVLEHIAASEFDHGGTRNRGFLACCDADYVLTMTQDALPKDERLIESLLRPMKTPETEGKTEDGSLSGPASGGMAFAGKEPDSPACGMASGGAASGTAPVGAIAVCYARQLPNEDAPIEEQLSRNFNYPDASRTKSEADRAQLGIKTYFCSNVCALYRMDIWRALGGFASPMIFNEDMVYAAAALRAGYRIRYEAGAQVYHSHRYTAAQQFHRNFDLGVSQAQHPEVFGGLSSEGEGVTYVKAVLSQMRAGHALLQVPAFLWRSGWRLVGYRMGKRYERLPGRLAVWCSSNRNFWNGQRGAKPENH